MKALIVNSSLCFCLFIFFSCKVNTVNPGKLPKRQVSIGSFGGFTGMNKKTIYLRNGQVFKSENMPGGTPTITYVKQIPRAKAKKLFKTIDRIDFNALDTPATANMNSYIERKRWIFKDHYYAWNTSLDSTDKNMKHIIELLKDQN